MFTLTFLNPSSESCRHSCIVYSLVGRLALGDIMSIVEPVDFLHQLVSFGAETDWLDVEIGEAFVLRVTYQLLRFNGHELGIEPSSKHLSVE